MRTFLLLTLLAANAAALPCDPKCDPQCVHKTKAKAKAEAAVVCEPQVRIRTTNGAQSCEATTVASGGHGGLVAVGQGVSASSPAVHSVSVASTAQGTCSASSSSASTKAKAGTSCVTVVASPSSTSCSEPVVVRVDPQQAQSLAGLAQLVRETRAGSQSGQAMDDETRENVRAALESAREAAREAIEEARESAREALEEAREAQRSAHDEAREAQKEAAEEVREAMREAHEAQVEAEREVAEALEEVRRENPQAFQSLYAMGADVQALTHEAMEDARKAYAEVWKDSDLSDAYVHYADANASDDDDREDAADREDGEDLEDRVRALEEMARAKGHATTDGSLEERVAALEKALGGSKSKTPKPSKMKMRTPRAWTYESGDGQSLRGFKVDEEGRAREFRIPSGTMRMAPFKMTTPVAPVPPVAPVAPVAPVPPVAPVAPHSRARAPAGMWSTPAPAAPSVSSDDRRAIEEAMRSLRDEADALREELMRMREQMESLPRKQSKH